MVDSAKLFYIDIFICAIIRRMLLIYGGFGSCTCATLVYGA